MQGGNFRRACDVCGTEHAYGPLHYGLRRNALYDILVCSSCNHSNAEGWAPELEERVLKNLKAAGKREPRRLRNGLLPYE